MQLLFVAQSTFHHVFLPFITQHVNINLHVGDFGFNNFVTALYLLDNIFERKLTWLHLLVLLTTVLTESAQRAK